MPSRITQDTNSLRIRDVFFLNPATQTYISSGTTFVTGAKGVIGWYDGDQIFSSIYIPSASTSAENLLYQAVQGFSSMSTLVTLSSFSAQSQSWIVSTFSTLTYWQINQPLRSTTAGLGTAGYNSTQALVLGDITVETFKIVDPDSSPKQSSIFYNELGTFYINGVSTFLQEGTLPSSVAGLGTAGYLSSFPPVDVENSNFNTARTFEMRITEEASTLYLTTFSNLQTFQAISGGAAGWTAGGFNLGGVAQIRRSEDGVTWQDPQIGSISTLPLNNNEMKLYQSSSNTSTILTGGVYIDEFSIFSPSTLWYSSDSGSNWKNISSIHLEIVKDIQYLSGIYTVSGTSTLNVTTSTLLAYSSSIPGKWTTYTIPFLSQCYSIAYNSNSGYWMAGGVAVDGTYNVGVSQNLQTWTSNSLNDGAVVSITSIQSDNAGNWIAAGSGTGQSLHLSQDNGSTWTTVAASIGAYKVYYKNGRWWCVCNTASPNVYTSTDRTTWTPIYTEILTAYSMAFDPSPSYNTFFLAGEGANVGGSLYAPLAKSTDGGLTFEVSTVSTFVMTFTTSSTQLLINGALPFQSTTLISTVAGLGTAGYVSSPAEFISTVGGLGSLKTYISSPEYLISTARGIGTAGYFSTQVSTLSTPNLFTQKLTIVEKGWNIQNLQGSQQSNTAIVKAFNKPIVTVSDWGRLDTTSTNLTPHSNSVYNNWSTFGFLDSGSRPVSLAYENSLFVAAGAGSSASKLLQTSPDGQTWTTISGNIFRKVNAIVYKNGNWMAGGWASDTFSGDRPIFTSPDGITWTPQTVSTTGYTYTVSIDYNATLNQWMCLTALGINSTRNLFQSTDNGVNWSSITVDLSGTFNGWGVATNDTDLWITVGFRAGEYPQMYSYTSSDGNNWNRKTFLGNFVGYNNIGNFGLSLQLPERSIKYIPQNSNFYLTMSSIVKRTQDGVTWQDCGVYPPFQWANDIIFDGFKYVMVGFNGVRVSYDGLNFYEKLDPSTILTYPGFFTSTVQFESTVAGLGSAGYVSSFTQSTVAGLATAGYLSSYLLESTVTGLGSAGYVSTVVDLVSTVRGLGTAGYASTVVDIPSTVAGLGTAGYLSTFSISFPSTVAGLGTADFVSTFSTSLFSTVRGLGSASFVSSFSSLTSSVIGLGTASYLSSLTSIPSTTQGLGRAGYVSSFAGLTSTVIGLGKAGYASTAADLPSTVIGLGKAGYISSTQLISTVRGLGTASYASTAITDANIESTVIGIGALGYISSLQLFSTVSHLGTAGYLSSLSTPEGYLPSSIGGLVSSGFVVSSQLDSTVQHLGRAGYLSTLTTVPAELQSTVIGLGRAGYVSSLSLQSTVIGLGRAGYVSSTQLLSSIAGLPSRYAKRTHPNSNYNFYFVSSIETSVSSFQNVMLNSSIQLSTATMNLSSVTELDSLWLYGSSLLTLEFLNVINLQKTTSITTPAQFITQLEHRDTGFIFGRQVYDLPISFSTFFIEGQNFFLTSNQLFSTGTYPSTLTVTHYLSTSENLQVRFNSALGNQMSWLTLNNLNPS